MNIKTTIGKTYAVTSPAECTITTPDGTLIATCQPGEQTCIVAPTTTIEISDDNALVTETFKGASSGSSAGGGMSVKKVEAIVDEALYDFDEKTKSTPVGDSNANWKWCELTAGHAPFGRLRALEIQCGSTATGGITTEPFYLGVWELSEDSSTWEKLGASTNAAAQVIGKATRWVFDDLELHGRALRLTGLPSPSGEWGAATIFRSRASASTDGSSMFYTSTSAYIPQLTFFYTEMAARFASADAFVEHGGDTVRHITAAERASWNAKADASALAGKVNSATFSAHAGDAVKHVTAAERTAWNDKIGSYGDFSIEGSLSLTYMMIADKYETKLSYEGVEQTPYGEDSGFVTWRTLIDHPTDTVCHLTADERATLVSLLDRAPELLALLSTTN